MRVEEPKYDVRRRGAIGWVYVALLYALAAVVPLAIGSSPSYAQGIMSDIYREPGLYPNRDYVNHYSNEHIDPFAGGLQWHYTDIHLPGNGGFDLDVVRSYNSQSVNSSGDLARYDSIAGLGWTIHFGRVLQKGTTPICANGNLGTVSDNPVLELQDGSQQLLAFTGGSSPVALTTRLWRADCIGGNPGGLAVYSPDGTRYDMTHMVLLVAGMKPIQAWYTTRITDRNNNFATVNYAKNGSPEIDSVSTSDGRRVSFSYDGSGAIGHRVRSITASSGQSCSYSYESAGVVNVYQLVNVVIPDGTTWRYSYNGKLATTTAGSYLMNWVGHPLGGTIAYGYDFSHPDPQSPTYRTEVVTSKSSQDGSWTFRYTQGTGGAPDTTTANSPEGVIVYQHVGPRSVGFGKQWMVGLLVSKSIGAEQTETYHWTNLQISNETYLRPGQFAGYTDPGTNAPLLLSKTISRSGGSYRTDYGGHDAYGNPRTISESGPGGSRSTSVSYSINAAKWIIHLRKDEIGSGTSITRSHDGSGNLLSFTQDGATTSYGYDGEGNVISITRPRGLTTTYGAHYRGIPQSESQPEGIHISRSVDGAGNVISETDGERHTRKYAYDGLNRVTRIVYPKGNPVTISHGGAITAKRGSLVETTVLDGYGRPVSATLGGITRYFFNDGFGRRIYESNPGDKTKGTTYARDILGRVTSIRNADSTRRLIADGGGSVTTTDERGNKVTYLYRSYGNPDERYLMGVQAGQSSVAITRNARDLVTSITQDGVTRSFEYDSRYYLVKATNPETGATTFGRDEAGNMVSRTVGASGSTYVYDKQNRLASATYPGSASAVTKRYTNTNRLSSVVSPAATRFYAYDANDNLTNETMEIDGRSFGLDYAYNGNDQLSSITYPQPSGATIAYSPDVLGRPTQVGGYAPAVSYWPSGQINRINYGNGTVSTYGQNARLWPSTFSTQLGSSIFQNAGYAYDGVGNLTAITDSVDANYNRTLDYDGVSRLTRVNGPWGSGTIAYSGAGNITNQVFGNSALNYGYDTQNRLANVSGARNASYAYDTYGNILADGRNGYTYDGVPNLTCVNCGDPARQIGYVYDGLNQRVAIVKAGVKTYEVYGSHGQLLFEYTPSNPAVGGPNKYVEHLYLGGKRIAANDRSLYPSATTVSVSTSAAKIQPGQSVTLTAQVTGNAPVGTVNFYDRGQLIGSATLVNGVATFTTGSLAYGLHSFSVAYVGNDANLSSATATSAVVESGNVVAALQSILNLLLDD